MSTSEQESANHTPGILEGMPKAPIGQEQRFRTIAVRVQEGLHSQLSFIAQLAGTTLSEEIRAALEQRIASAQDDPDLIAKAGEVRAEIEREAAARSAAIAGFMGHTISSATVEKPTNSSRGRRTAKRTNA